MNAVAARGALEPFAHLSVVLTAGTIAGRVTDGALSILLPACVVAVDLAVILAARIGRSTGPDVDPFDECGWCGGPVCAGEDYCSEYCEEAAARADRAADREPVGTHLHLTAAPGIAGGRS